VLALTRALPSHGGKLKTAVVGKVGTLLTEAVIPTITSAPTSRTVTVYL
jgi:hypothetical protein